MSDASETDRGPIFPPWFDNAVKVIGAFMGVGLVFYVTLFVLAASPSNLDVGYQPDQPIPYSHQLHVGELGMDCRYCHTMVEETSAATVPPTATCMNCHATILTDSDELVPLMESWATGLPVRWKRVHDLPDYAYFDHSAHVNRGIGCISCHGRIDKMPVVRQVEPLSMGWCLECHREPEKHLRPQDQITSMTWTPEGDQLELGRRIREERDINPSTSCSTCHR